MARALLFARGERIRGAVYSNIRHISFSCLYMKILSRISIRCPLEAGSVKTVVIARLKLARRYFAWVRYQRQPTSKSMSVAECREMQALDYQKWHPNRSRKQSKAGGKGPDATEQ